MTRPTKERVRENKVRRIAQRRGFRVERSRRRDPQALDYARYWLIRVEDKEEMLSRVELDDVEEWLNAYVRDEYRPDHCCSTGRQAGTLGRGRRR